MGKTVEINCAEFIMLMNKADAIFVFIWAFIEMVRNIQK